MRERDRQTDRERQTDRQTDRQIERRWVVMKKEGESAVLTHNERQSTLCERRCREREGDAVMDGERVGARDRETEGRDKGARAETLT